MTFEGADARTTRRSEARRLKRSRRWPRRTLVGVLALVGLAVWAFAAPVPILDGVLLSAVSGRVAARIACPGTSAPKITIGGGRVLPQLLADRLSEVHVTMPDVALGGLGHAHVEAALRDVSHLTADTPQADAVTSTVTVGFDDLPVPAGPRPRFGRSSDGSLTVSLPSTGTGTSNLTGTLFLALELKGETVTAVPRRLQLLGRTLTGEKAAELAGGTRTHTLPHLPDGVRYTSVLPRPDGVHVALGGSVTRPLSALPKTSGSLPLTYQTGGGLLGIHTSVTLPGLGVTPLTIFTAPRITGHTLTFEPQSVEVLGVNRPPSDAIAAVVLSQVRPSDLSADLPVLPTGVRYRSVKVTGSGITVVVGGVTVRPFSELAATEGGSAVTYGVQDGLLTATAGGGTASTPASGAAAGTASGGVLLVARPRITGNTLDLSPRTVEVFGVQFPAADVLSQVKGVTTTFRLPVLGGGLRYTGVEVLPTGLRLQINGESVPLSAELFGATRCNARAAS